MRRDYGDPPAKSYSIIGHLRKICPGTWTYKHPGHWWHESGVRVCAPLDYAKANLLYIVGAKQALARRNPSSDSGWQWLPEGEALLKRLTGVEL